MCVKLHSEGYLGDSRIYLNCVYMFDMTLNNTFLLFWAGGGGEGSNLKKVWDKVLLI